MNSQPDKPADNTVSERMAALADDLDTILNDLLDVCVDAAGRDKEQEVRQAVKVEWRPGDDPQELVEQVIEQALMGASETSPIRGGHVYCYACGTAKCDHAAPTTHGDVFMGYRNNGEPIWQEFFNALNALGDKRVDMIFADRPKPLAHFINRRQLIADQLHGSGRNSMTYRIICQVIAGYFDIGGNRCALTLQVVENPRRDLHLQLLAPDSVREVMTENQSTGRTLTRLYAAVNDLRHSLQDFQTRWSGAKGQRERQNVQVKLERLMHHLVNVIERKGRQGQRRTIHAHERSKDNRPVHTAMRDLEAAGTENFFHDLPRKSIIILGKRSRAHVFSASGRHITTMQLPQEKLDRRVQRKRYAPMDPAEVNAFRATVSADRRD